MFAKQASGTPKFFGEHLARRMGEPLRNQQGLVFGKIAIVKDKKKLAPLLEPLNGVRNASWEEPHISGLQIVHEHASIDINDRHATRPSVT